MRNHGTFFCFMEGARLYKVEDLYNNGVSIMREEVDHDEGNTVRAWICPGIARPDAKRYAGGTTS